MLPIDSKHDTQTASLAALRRTLMDASAALASSSSEEIDSQNNSTQAGEWIARLVPVWRELVARNRRASPKVGVVPATPGEIDVALKLIDGFLLILAARLPQVVREHERYASIEKAKQEWECTADALTGLVCLLNGEGLVLRANRVVELWNLGSVNSVIGKNAHDMLHPTCVELRCRLALALETAWPKLRDGESFAFEFYAPATDQTRQFTLQPMRPSEAENAPRDSRAVLVVTDVSALRHAQQALENVNLNLESRVHLRTRELGESNRDLLNEVARRELAEQELRASRNNLALLSEQLIQAQEGERRRIALELHDSVGQSLSAIKYTVERAIIMLQRPELGSPEGVLTSAVQRIHETADGIRAISMNLRPQMLDNLGAASAATWFCRGFAEVYSTIDLRREITAQNSEIPKRISTHLFRCLQELLNNVAKHARATSVTVELKREGTLLSLEVRDNGVGMTAGVTDPARLQGSGIRNLRERAEMTGGHFAISSAAGSGTTANIQWLLDPQAPLDEIDA